MRSDVTSKVIWGWKLRLKIACLPAANGGARHCPGWGLHESSGRLPAQGHQCTSCRSCTPCSDPLRIVQVFIASISASKRPRTHPSFFTACRKVMSTYQLWGKPVRWSDPANPYRLPAKWTDGIRSDLMCIPILENAEQFRYYEFFCHSRVGRGLQAWVKSLQGWTTYCEITIKCHSFFQIFKFPLWLLLCSGCSFTASAFDTMMFVFWPISLKGGKLCQSISLRWSSVLNSILERNIYLQEVRMLWQVVHNVTAAEGNCMKTSGC